MNTKYSPKSFQEDLAIGAEATMPPFAQETKENDDERLLQMPVELREKEHEERPNTVEERAGKFRLQASLLTLGDLLKERQLSSSEIQG